MNLENLNIIEIFFLIAAVIAFLSALMTVMSHNVVHALMYLVVMMLAIALIFFLLGASFASALQVIVYAGAIMVLFIFVTMMLHQGDKSLSNEHKLFQYSGSVISSVFSSILFIELVLLLNLSTKSHSFSDSSQSFVSVKQLAEQIYGSYHLLVILAAMMLLSALISAIHIANKQESI